MATDSSIEWTDSTWNPVTGCTRVSRGCDLCYAVRMTKRLEAMGHDKYSGLVNAGKGHFNGVVKVHPETLRDPLSWKTPRIVFVNSMSDLFHNEVPEDFIREVFDVMEEASHHTFQVLTKRPARMTEVLSNLQLSNGRRLAVNPLDNVWLGTSVEDEEAVHRVDELRLVPAAVRFISLEPLLGPIPELKLAGIQWVIAGGESGPGARPMDVSWVESIISVCRRSDVAVFVKQLGANPYDSSPGLVECHNRIPVTGKGGNMDEWPSEIRVREMPQPVQAALA